MSFLLFNMIVSSVLLLICSKLLSIYLHPEDRFKKLRKQFFDLQGHYFKAKNELSIMRLTPAVSYEEHTREMTKRDDEIALLREQLSLKEDIVYTPEERAEMMKQAVLVHSREEELERQIKLKSDKIRYIIKVLSGARNAIFTDEEIDFLIRNLEVESNG